MADFYSHQDTIPGKQSEMPHEALEEYLPGPDGKPELYKAAGKLKGKKGMCIDSARLSWGYFANCFFSTHHWWRVCTSARSSPVPL